jgi:hypothetical protein
VVQGLLVMLSIFVINSKTIGISVVKNQLMKIAIQRNWRRKKGLEPIIQVHYQLFQKITVKSIKLMIQALD